MFVVMGASGHTGRGVAETLLGLGKKVRAIGRSADRLSAFAARGAELATGDATDAGLLAGAFAGAEGVYAMVPPDYRQPDPRAYYSRCGDVIAEAVRRGGVQRIVFLSSLGGELSGGTGPIAGLHDVEKKLGDLGADLRILRPGYFYDNFFSALPLIKSRGVNGGAIEPNAAFPMTSTADIGAAAGKELAYGTFQGTSVRELLGPRDYTMAGATRILGKEIGKPDLAYVRFTDSDFVNSLVASGFSEGVAASFVEMAAALSSGLIRSHQGRTPNTTMPTSFETFANALAAAYRAL
jgi:uncharacterized protein YbjT (DUF2867 family)